MLRVRIFQPQILRGFKKGGVFLSGIKKSIVFLLFLSIMGCGSISPSLYPIPKIIENPVSGLEEKITFFVKPVITTGFSQEERKEYKVDLSAHFTSFDITVLNGTHSPVEIKPELFSLVEDEGSPLLPLSMEETLDYFRNDGDLSEETIRLFSKPYRLIKRERESLKKLYLQNVLKPLGIGPFIYFNKLTIIL